VGCKLNQALRAGIGPVLIVGVLIVVVVVAGAGAYVFVFAAPGVKNTTTTSSIGTTTATSGVQGLVNYKGTFTYGNPLGPSGINDMNGRMMQWNSTMGASGSFTFSIDPRTYIGTGQGQGSITVSTHGYCTGSNTVQYSFTITAVHTPGQNFIISFNTPTPQNVMVQLNCQGSTMGFNMANNPIAYLSVYPNGVSMASVPYSTTQAPTYGVSYTVTITQA
jgi:hypothetical protein